MWRWKKVFTMKVSQGKRSVLDPVDWFKILIAGIDILTWESSMEQLCALTVHVPDPGHDAVRSSTSLLKLGFCYATFLVSVQKQMKIADSRLSQQMDLALWCSRASRSARKAASCYEVMQPMHGHPLKPHTKRDAAVNARSKQDCESHT